MRRLYVVPIIHMSADMGSMASTLDESAARETSPELWQRHKITIAAFWDAIGNFLDRLDAAGLKIYQDGLVAEGEAGLKIVREGVSQGSKNYEIIGKLLERGAVLVMTESLSLVKQEYAYIVKIARARSPRERETYALRYKLARGNLLKRRDEFISARINETLGGSETGILFIGAYHDVTGALAGDIEVVQVKEIARVRAYHSALVKTGRTNNGQIEELGKYLISPISLSI